jgi:cell division protein FtsW
MKTRPNEYMDGVLFYDVIALVCIGFLMIWSASSVYALNYFHDSLYFVKRQVFWLILSGALGLWAFKLDHDKLKKCIGIGMAISIVLLFAVHIPHIGHKVGGAKRWIKVGPLVFQPFELAKIFYVLYLAQLFADNDNPPSRKFIRSAVVTGITLIGLVLQKDLGGSIIIMLIYITTMMITGVNLAILGAILAALAVMVVVLIKVEPYRMHRFLSFLDPWKDPLGTGYQTIQSLIAVGSGGIFGVGFSHSQQKLLYLPALHTDYIFSITAEELGLIGCTFIIGLFALLLVRGAFIAINVKDTFLKLAAAGLTFMLTIQAGMNIAVSLGLMPSKGTTLPFISAGGSSLMVSAIAVGILLSISKAAYGRGGN